MATQQECAQLALYVYNVSDEINRPLLPDGWSVVEYHPDNILGFSCGVFRNASTNEVVVSFTGTNGTLDWLDANLPAGLGIGSPQIGGAAVAAAHAIQTYGWENVTFTGHSLGGGLGSMMGLWFDRPSVVFDEAPFTLSALNPVIILASQATLDAAGLGVPSFSVFNPLLAPFRMGQIVDYYTQGEALSYLRLPGTYIASQDLKVPVNNDGLGLDFSVNLHSQALLTALTTSQAFQSGTYASDRILPLIFDENFYNFSTSTSNQRNLLVDFVRSEQEQGSNGKLTNFGNDMSIFKPYAQGLGEAAQNGIVAQALEWYYWKPTETYSGGVFFTTGATGALQYTTASGDDLPDAQNKASAYVKSWLEHVANDHGLVYSGSMAIHDQWTVATSNSGAVATADDATKSQIFIGGGGADNFTGGDLDDLMFGGEGNDTLVGGTGSDELFGGAGNDDLQGGAGYDEYRIEGHDTVTDSDGAGFIEDKSGERIAGIIEKNEDGTYTFVGDSGITVTGDTDLTLTLADGSQVTIKNFQDGELGLQLTTPGTPVQSDRTIVGDLQPKDFDPSAAGIQTQTDDLGNVIVDPNTPAPDRSDFLYDSTGNDDIQGKGGFDYIEAFRGGDDKLDGGIGTDIVLGRAGNDTVIGGDGADLLRGDAGEDEIYAGGEVSLDDALAAEDATPSGLKGDFADGGTEDDFIVGDTGNDALNGGNGADIIVGGAGDDDLDGDLETSSVSMAWSTARSVTTEADGSTIYLTTYNGVSFTVPTAGGDDAIFAGGGVDWVRAGYGNDYVDGGSGNDILFGEAGSDEIFGGTGDDMLAGDTASVDASQHGDDYLDGEDGNDSIYGYGGSDALFGGAGDDIMVGDMADTTYAGNDYLDGEDGNDTILGGAKDDEMYGGAGNDFLQGDSGTNAGDGNDSISGEDGDDTLFGELGHDSLDGGAGNDLLVGDNGGSDPAGDADTLTGGAGADRLFGQGGDDAIDGGDDNDVALGGDGNDTMAGGDGADQLQGGDGSDVIDGGAGSDTIFGEAGNDTLTGGADTDFLLGGQGNDVIDGGDGDDVYYWSTGDGNDTISDSSGNDWLVFNDITLGQVTLGVGSLKLMLPGGGSIDLTDFDPDNPYAAGGIENFYFADSTAVSKAALIQLLGFHPTGTPGPDALDGTALADTMHGLDGDDVLGGRAGNDLVYGDAGNDELHGGDGDDLLSGGDGNDLLLADGSNDTLDGGTGDDFLAGGAGNDQLLGGDGNDAFMFDIGWGQDTAVDSSGSNRVVLGSSLTLDAIVFGRSGDDLVVSVKNAGDNLTVKDWFTTGSSFADVVLGDGTSLDHAGVEANMPSNLAPVAQPDTASVTEDALLSATGNALANDSDPEGHALRITNPGNYTGSYGTFTLQSDGTYAYALSNGSTAVQSLGASQSASDAFTYTVTDDDPSAPASSQGTVTVTIHGANDAPVAAADAASILEGGSPISGNVFANDHDVDAGTVLAIANPGVGTGGWGTLTLNADGSWTYALANGSQAVESLAAGQVVTDNFTFAVSDGIVQVGETLSITVTGQDDAPVLAQALLDQATSTNTKWTWQLPAGSFTDVDYGDTLSYAATLADGSALPTWLSFDPATQTFAGRVPKDATGSIDIKLLATDKAGLGTSDVFNLSFSGTKHGGGGGGGSGGGRGGNEGVGNGEDPPPPGHDYNFNDGPGTSPGNPGAKWGDGYVPPSHDAILDAYVGDGTGVQFPMELVGVPALVSEAA